MARDLGFLVSALGVPLRVSFEGSLKVSFKGSFKGSIGFRV